MYLAIFPYTLIQRLFASLLSRLYGEPDVPIDESHPANRKIIGYLKSNSGERTRWAPNYFDKPHEMQADVYTFEELYKMGERLPKFCFSISYGYPVLAYPRGGVIFAVAKGNGIIALRLPSMLRSEALTSRIAKDILHIPGGLGYPDDTIPASELGDDWVFTFLWGKNDDRIQEWMSSAYDYASELD